MQTDFNSQWRKARFLPKTADSPAVAALKQNFNAIADNPAIGDAMTAALRPEFPSCKFQSVDVAVYYLVKTSANAASGPINLTLLFKELAGDDIGPALLNAFDNASEVGSPANINLGLGDEFITPAAIATDRELQVGSIKRNKRGQYAGLNVTERFTLAQQDVTRLVKPIFGGKAAV